jgi:hypothetical protein
LPAGFWVSPVQSRGNDSRVVQYEHIAGIQVFKQAGKLAMLDFPRPSVQYQQTRIVPPCGGLLRDEFGRQIEMIIGGSQRRERSGVERGLTIHIGNLL